VNGGGDGKTSAASTPEDQEKTALGVVKGFRSASTPADLSSIIASTTYDQRLALFRHHASKFPGDPSYWFFAELLCKTVESTRDGRRLEVAIHAAALGHAADIARKRMVGKGIDPEVVSVHQSDAFPCPERSICGIDPTTNQGQKDDGKPFVAPGSCDLVFLRHANYNEDISERQIEAAVENAIPGAGLFMICILDKQLSNVGPALDKLLSNGTLSIVDWWEYSPYGFVGDERADSICVVFRRNARPMIPAQSPGGGALRSAFDASVKVLSAREADARRAGRT